MILLPVYNDWDALQRLLAGLQAELPQWKRDCLLLIVDDGSAEAPPVAAFEPWQTRIIHLTHNIGHQKAIAIGLSYAHHQLPFEKLLIMDSDGEDRPEDAAALLSGNHTPVVVNRKSRQEGLRFRFFYALYKLLFLVLTGKRIGFGNFMLLGPRDVRRLVHDSGIWNHLAGTVLRSGMPIRTITAHRGKRYEGRSRMNFHALLLHGLGAIGVFIELIASRLLILSLVLILASLAAIGVIVCIKLFTARAIPGWATTAVSAMLIVLLQGFLLSLFTIFLYLSFQGQRKFIPAHHYMDYVGAIENDQQDG